jgi:hypothetical protein
MYAIPDGCPECVLTVAQAIHKSVMKHDYPDNTVCICGPDVQSDHWCVSDNYDGRFFGVLFRYYPATDSWLIGQTYGETDGRPATYDDVLGEAEGTLEP